MIELFETERLIAERLRATDLQALCRMHQDARVMEMLGGVRSDAATRAYLEVNLRHWEEHGFGLYALFDKSSRRFAGRAGLRHVAVGGAPEVELAYALLAQYWGLGLASEAGKALVSIGLGALRLKSIVCFAFTSNHASQRVMKKLRFTYERDIDHNGLPHVLYRMAAIEA